MIGHLAWSLGLILLLSLPSQARAALASCPLALVLALDSSSSIDRHEDRLQLDGLARALADPSVRSAILATGGVLITAFEWSGRDQQVTIADWTFLDSDASIFDFAQSISAHQRRFDDYPTAIGFALGYAAVRLGQAPLSCARKVIDMSGDGVLNDGFTPEAAYRNFKFEGVTVNGLVIKGEWPDPEPYYRNHVLRGAGAFLEVTEGYVDYSEAMKQKLLREIRGPVLSELR